MRLKDNSPKRSKAAIVWICAKLSATHLNDGKPKSEFNFRFCCIKPQIFCFSSFKELTVEFKSSFFYPKVKVRVITLFEYLGSVGGLLMLVAGISLLSFFDALQVVMRISCRRVFEKLKNFWAHLAVKIELPFVIRYNKNHTLYYLLQHVRQFMEATNIHGARQTVDNRRSGFERFSWALMMLGSFAFCFVLVRDALKYSERNPVVVSIDSKMWTSEDVSTRRTRENFELLGFSS